MFRADAVLPMHDRGVGGGFLAPRVAGPEHVKADPGDDPDELNRAYVTLRFSEDHPTRSEESKSASTRLDPEQRQQDALKRLEQDVDAWVATRTQLLPVLPHSSGPGSDVAGGTVVTQLVTRWPSHPQGPSVRVVDVTRSPARARLPQVLAFLHA
jgi:hypothetical protein